MRTALRLVLGLPLVVGGVAACASGMPSVGVPPVARVEHLEASA